MGPCSTRRRPCATCAICYGLWRRWRRPRPRDLLTKGLRAFEAMPGNAEVKHKHHSRAVRGDRGGTPDSARLARRALHEAHRGPYTSQGWIKLANRKAEWALHEAEAMPQWPTGPLNLVEAMAGYYASTNSTDIPNWHSIGEVFEDAARDFVAISARSLRRLAQDAAAALTVQGWSAL